MSKCGSRDTIYLGYNPNEFTPSITPQRKSRGFLYNQSGDVVYQVRENNKYISYPGGKLDDRELNRVSFEREIFEEAVTNFVKTQYFAIECDLDQLSEFPPNPTYNETDGGLKNYISNIEDMPRIIEEYETDNPRWEFMKREMIAVTFKFLGIYKDELF